MAHHRDPLVDATSALLAAAGAIHVAWGLRVSIPGVDPAKVADAVGSGQAISSREACLAVAVALGAASALVAGHPRRWPWVRRTGQVGVAAVLAGRGALGLAGRTDIVAPGPTSERFQRWDRRVYTPLCLALSAGAARAAWPTAA
jgi:hypothetical protein